MNVSVVFFPIYLFTYIYWVLNDQIEAQASKLMEQVSPSDCNKAVVIDKVKHIAHDRFKYK